MATQSDAGLYEILQAYIYQHAGVLGSLAFGLACAAGLVWWKWPDISARPGVAMLLRRIKRDSIPRSDPNRFSVLVAHLENDNAEENENLVREALAEFPGIQVLSLDRTINPKGLSAKEREQIGHQQARQFMMGSGASIVVWGTVLRHDGKSVPKLFLTASEDQASRSGRYVPLPDQLHLPPLFWADLKSVLLVVIAAQWSAVAQNSGHFIAERLPKFIERVRALVRSEEANVKWDGGTLFEVKMFLASTLYVHGRQIGDSNSLNEAAAIYEDILAGLPRERIPLGWAGLQNYLGRVLARLGEWKGEPNLLERAVTAQRNALLEFTPDNAPSSWAAAHNDLGCALRQLGEREMGTEKLEEAVSHHTDSLRVWTREYAPMLWATAKFNLGSALCQLGRRQYEAELIGRGVAELQRSWLEVTYGGAKFDPDRIDRDVAKAMEQARQGIGTQNLNQAVDSLRDALLEQTRVRGGFDWASTQNTLGAALLAHGMHEDDVQRIKEAIKAFEEALLEWTRERVPMLWAGIMSNLGVAFTELASRERDVERYEQAIKAYADSLSVRNLDENAFEWASTQNNLGKALMGLGKQTNEIRHLEGASKAFDEALKIFSSCGANYYVDMTRRNREAAKRLLDTVGAPRD